MTDKDLISRTLDKDPAAFADLVDRYRDAVCGVAYHYLGNFDDVQDAAQEAFLQAYSSLPQLREPDKFGPWVRQITTNICLQTLRRRDNKNLPLEAAPEQSTEDDTHKSALRLVVREALAKLSDKTRLTVTLCYINGYSHDEVAQFLEVPLNTVRSRLRIAKKQLREEMIEMVHDVLHEDKPDQEFTRKVVEEAMRQAEEARKTHATGDALNHYDAALTAIEDIEPGEEQLRLRMEALWQKALAGWLALSFLDTISLKEQALAIAKQLGDRERIAEISCFVALDYDMSLKQDKASEYMHEALDTYSELGDTQGQGKCLWWLATQSFETGGVEICRQYVEQALPLLETSAEYDWAAVCGSMLRLLDDTRDVPLASLSHRAAVCECLQNRDGILTYVSQPGWGGGGNELPALNITSVFSQINHLHKILDVSAGVGDSWSGDTLSLSMQPLRATMSVISDSEVLELPAGTFQHCLLLEQVTTESGLRDDADEVKKSLNREARCGTRRIWFAPGIGLVQLHVVTGDSNEATIQLQDYNIEEPTKDYLPLAVGNAWTYGWAGVPEEHVAREKYRVYANQNDLWYLEHWMYAYKNRQQDQ